jgi:hypothetical protein
LVGLCLSNLVGRPLLLVGLILIRSITEIYTILKSKTNDKDLKSIIGNSDCILDGLEDQ